MASSETTRHEAAIDLVEECRRLAVYCRQDDRPLAATTLEDAADEIERLAKAAFPDETDRTWTFRVFEPDGSEPNLEQIALNEPWAKGLMYCDMEGFALQWDGTLLLTDECGKFRCCPMGRFRVEFNT